MCSPLVCERAFLFGIEEGKKIIGRKKERFFWEIKGGFASLVFASLFWNCATHWLINLVKIRIKLVFVTVRNWPVSPSDGLIASSAMQEIHKIFTIVIEYSFFFYKFLDSWWGNKSKKKILFVMLYIPTRRKSLLFYSSYLWLPKGTKRRSFLIYRCANLPHLNICISLQIKTNKIMYLIILFNKQNCLELSNCT